VFFLFGSLNSLFGVHALAEDTGALGRLLLGRSFLSLGKQALNLLKAVVAEEHHFFVVIIMFHFCFSYSFNRYKYVTIFTKYIISNIFEISIREIRNGELSIFCLSISLIFPRYMHILHNNSLRQLYDR
jgi:hypothetical protein